MLSLTNNQWTNGFIVPFVETRLTQSSRIYFLIWTIYLVSEPRIIFHHHSTIPLSFTALLWRYGKTQPWRHKDCDVNNQCSTTTIWRVVDNSSLLLTAHGVANLIWGILDKGESRLLTLTSHLPCTWDEQISSFLNAPRRFAVVLTARCVWVKQSAGKLLWCHATRDAIVKRQGPFH